MGCRALSLGPRLWADARGTIYASCACGGSQLVKCANDLQHDAVGVCELALLFVLEDEIKEARRGFRQHEVKGRHAGLVSAAKIGAEYDDRLLSVCVSASQQVPGI